MSVVTIIIGNLFSLLALLADGLSTFRKTTKGILLMQSIAQASLCAGSVVLKGYSGAVQNVISIVRNLVAAQEKQYKWAGHLLVVLGVVLGICFNNRGVYGWLPIIANLEYSVAVFRFRDNERALKIAFLISIIPYAMFNVVILNFVGAISNVALIVVTAMALCKKSKTDEANS